MIAADLAFTAYAEYQDVTGYRRGEISGRYLGFKSALRGSQVSLALYAAAAPEPLTKTVAGLTAGALLDCRSGQ